MKTTLKKFFLLGTAAMMLHISASAQVVTTLATGVLRPRSIFVGKGDTLYVFSDSEHSIYKVSPTGVVTVFVGSGIAGSADGIGTSASFGSIPQMIADADGTIYATDASTLKIRKITPAGEVSTLSVIGNIGTPTGMVWGKGDTLIVNDLSTGKLNKVSTSSGIVKYFTTSPNNVTSASKGVTDTFYLANHQKNQIYRVNHLGVVDTFAGSGIGGSVDGIGLAAKFSNPSCIAIDGVGNLFVTDSYNNKIRKITPSRVVSTFAGSGTAAVIDGTGIGAAFNNPFCIAMSPTTGIFYIGESGSGAIRKMTGGVPLPVKLNNITPTAAELKVYPSPFTEVFTISSSKAQSAQLMNNLGQVLLQIDVVAGEQQVSMVGQPSGIYYIKSESGAAQRIVKL